ncbi:MAG: NAD(P)-binding domain-containing protein, partial [Dongiaceae bacterium]
MSDQKIVLPGPLLLVGCGKMGGALLRGWLGRGIAGRDVFVVDPAPRDLEDVQARGVSVVTAINQLPAGLRRVVLLAIKPQ